MKKNFKKVFNSVKDSGKELTLEEANALIFGTTKPKPGQPMKQWTDKAPNIKEIIRKEKQEELLAKLNLEESNSLAGIDPNKKILKPPGSSQKVPIHPRDIPQMKLEKVYAFDTIQLIESLKYIEFKKENVNKFINFLSVLRKKREIKIYDFPEILNVIEFIRKNLYTISPSYQINFFYSLSKVQNFDDKKPSLDDQNLVFEVLTHITSNIKKIDIRSMSNLAYGLHTLQLNNPQIYNFDEFFSKLEEQIISKISKQIKQLTAQDVSNIILAYCKTQNGSEEFYRILQEIVIDMKMMLKPQDVAVIMYSYANNPTCTEKIIENLEDVVRKNIAIYKPKEICSILRAFHMRKLLTEELKSLFTEAFIQKHELTNATDLAYFYSILAENDNPRFLKFAHKCINNLFFTFSPEDLRVLLDKAGFILEKEPEIYKLLQNHVIKHVKKGNFKGFDLKKIYLSVKDLPCEGKYNIFVEDLERQLQKLKYF